MIAVLHDQPIRFILATPRFATMWLTADSTSLAAVTVSAKGLLSAAGLAVSGGRV
jgi:hypothetical protein